MTEGFRRTATGRIVVRLDSNEKALLTALAEQLLDIVAPPTNVNADPLAVELGLEDLDTAVDLSGMGLLEERDPVTQRLFPDAYEQPGDAMEFRRFTEMGLRQAKTAAARTMLDYCMSSGEKITLNRNQAMSWLTALNDMRLALAVRLGIETPADAERLASESEDDDVRATYHVYDYLAFLQETLVRAVS